MPHVHNKHLYRIYYYDCLPFDKKICNPVTKKVTDFKKTTQYNFRIQFFEELKKKRKVAFVNQIVLISGDADFVPASKLARREGVDFVLDPMWANIDDLLLKIV